MYVAASTPIRTAALRAGSAVVVAVLLTVVLIATVPAAPVAATTTDGSSGIEDAPDTPLYLALGDSVAFGIGASEPDRTDYVAQLYELLRDRLQCNSDAASGCRPLHTVDLSEPGATTNDVINDQLPAALQLISARNADDDPLNDVEAVTLTIGGNDVFRPVLAACATDPTLDCVPVVASSLGQVANNLPRILGPLGQAAGTGTTIAVMTYYNPLPGCELAPLAPLADVILEGGTHDGLSLPEDSGLNDIIRGVAWSVDAATPADVVVADTYGDLQPGDFVGGEDCLHPDDSGYDSLTEEFAAVVPA